MQRMAPKQQSAVVEFAAARSKKRSTRKAKIQPYAKRMAAPSNSAPKQKIDLTLFQQNVLEAMRRMTRQLQSAVVRFAATRPTEKAKIKSRRNEWPLPTTPLQSRADIVYPNANGRELRQCLKIRRWAVRLQLFRRLRLSTPTGLSGHRKKIAARSAIGFWRLGLCPIINNQGVLDVP